MFYSFMGFKNCILLCVYHYSIVQNSLTAGKMSLCFTYSSVTSLLPQNLWQPLIFLFVYIVLPFLGLSLVAQLVKNPPAIRDTWLPSLGWEDPLEKGKATHSSILAWRIPWIEEPGGLQSKGSQRIRHD